LFGSMVTISDAVGVLVRNSRCFLAAPWLQKGLNQVVVFDFNDLDGPQLRGVGNPIWSK
jgi:hypothetical protein